MEGETEEERMRRKLRLQMNSEKEIKAAAHRAIMAEK